MKIDIIRNYQVSVTNDLQSFPNIKLFLRIRYALTSVYLRFVELANNAEFLRYLDQVSHLVGMLQICVDITIFEWLVTLMRNKVITWFYLVNAMTVIHYGGVEIPKLVSTFA